MIRQGDDYYKGIYGEEDQDSRIDDGYKDGSVYDDDDYLPAA